MACATRYLEIGDTVVVGISPDPPPALARFDQKHGLGFILLSNPDHAVADAYRAWGEKKMYGRTYRGVLRSAFLIDERGKVAQVWPKVSPKETATERLLALAG